MTRAEHRLWRDFLRPRCGLDFPETRARYLGHRLWTRMSRLGLDDYADYFRRLTTARVHDGEWDELLAVLLNHQSGFFRHPPSFEALGRSILPDLMTAKRRASSNRITLWSAGCADGQEAYSLALTAREHCDPECWRVGVLGSDLGDLALTRARAGRFRPRDVAAVPEAWRRRFFAREGEGYRIDDAVRAMVQFGRVNLADPATYPQATWDVIFCQNVLIYFEADDRNAVVDRLCDRLAPGGWLVLGPAEVLGLKRPELRALTRQEALVYQRVD